MQVAQQIYREDVEGGHITIFSELVAPASLTANWGRNSSPGLNHGSISWRERLEKLQVALPCFRSCPHARSRTGSSASI